MKQDATLPQEFQRLDLFRLPPGFRGKGALFVQLWWLMQALLVKPLPQKSYEGARQMFLKQTSRAMNPTLRK
jgi:putative colanic acid biosynthesis acetyltransferase WcaF